MAQHIPIEKFKQKVFKKIENSIKNDFKSPYINGSLKYEKLENIVGSNFIKDYQENENDEVYKTERYIGKGFIWGSNRGYFEIHFDRLNKRILNIYLVA